jgi:glycosyltransferase involved in cell wall biosynthesis
VAHRVLGWIEDFSRRRSDGVIALGDCMRARLVARGIPGHLVHVAENWADGSVITARPPRRDGPLHVLYSGNLGLSHDVETIAAAMRHFRNDSRFEFTFAGGGVKRSLLQDMCRAEGIVNARFTPYCGRHQMGEHLAQADVGLVTEQPVCVGTVVPSKVYGLMAAGRPILFVGPVGATPELLIRKFGCGWSIEPGAGDQLISLLERLWSDRESVGMRGRRARQAFERHYDLPLGVERIAAILGAAPASDTERAPEHFVTHC